MNKRVFIIVAIILTFFSFINLSITSIVASYDNNINKMNNEIIGLQGSTISISKSYSCFTNEEIDFILKEKSIYNEIISEVYSNKTEALYYDYSNLNNDNLNISNVDYIFEGSNYIFINSKNNEYENGDIINISGIDYVFGGYYESDTISKPICDLSYSLSVGYFNIVIEFNEKNISNTNIAKFNEFYNDLKKLDNNYLSTYSYSLENYKNNRKDAIKVELIIILFQIILVVFMLGIIANSFAIIYSDNSYYLSLLYCLGSSMNIIRIVVIAEYILLSIISLIISGIIIVLFRGIYTYFISYLLGILNENMCYELSGIHSVSFNTNILTTLAIFVLLVIISILFGIKFVNKKNLKIKDKSE